MVVVVVLMGDRVRLGLVGGKTARPPNTREKKPLVAGNPPGDPICLPPCKTSGNCRNFAELYLRSFKTYHLQT